VDLTALAIELLDRLPANRTLGLTVVEDADDRAALAGLQAGRDARARFTTLTTIDGDDAPRAAEGEFDWVVRLAPG
jgi:hypothetical protein